MLETMKMRYLLLCVAVGSAVGGIMILTHRGPGITVRAASSTPQSRNDVRTQSIHQLASALTQYQKDHGSLPVKLTPSATQICAGDGATCTQYHLTDLSFLTTEGNYIPTLPIDPVGGEGNRGTGFFISEQSDGTITITAPEAEDSKQISVTFSL